VVEGRQKRWAGNEPAERVAPPACSLNRQALVGGGRAIHVERQTGAVHRPGSYLFLWRKDFLNTDLVNEVLATKVSQVSSLLLIGQVCTDAVDHYHDESAIIHIKPIRTADELVLAVPDEWTVKVG